MNNTANNWKQTLRQALLSDPKKSIALAVLTLVMGTMATRAFLGKSRPAGARAATAASAGKPGASARSADASDTSRANPYAQLIQKWTEAPVPPVSRNLFAVRVEYFPVDGSRTTNSAGADEGFWGRLEKSITMKADLRDKRENLIANFKAQASQLRLQSTVMGPEPKALVNGELVGEGSVVANFRVLKIEARRIIVEREGIRLEIQMK